MYWWILTSEIDLLVLPPSLPHWKIPVGRITSMTNNLRSCVWGVSPENLSLVALLLMFWFLKFSFLTASMFFNGNFEFSNEITDKGIYMTTRHTTQPHSQCLSGRRETLGTRFHTTLGCQCLINSSLLSQRDSIVVECDCKGVFIVGVQVLAQKFLDASSMSRLGDGGGTG